MVAFKVALHIHPARKISGRYKDKSPCELTHVRKEERDNRQVMFLDPCPGYHFSLRAKAISLTCPRHPLWPHRLPLTDLDIDGVSVKSICYVWTPAVMAAISNKSLSKEVCAGGWISIRLSMKWAR